MGGSLESEASMSDAAQLKSINCTNCGAGLPVLGGGRVTTQICGYCGASLDATDSFRVLDVYAGMERPDTPFQLGMTGVIDGVEFTITGIKGMIEHGYGQWVDHMLFSPTHGYAWLTLENGHLIFTRKQRELPSAWLSVSEVEIAENKPSRTFRGKKFSYYETTNWQVHFVEGAFNYRPERDDKGTTVSLASWSGTPQMLSLIEPDKAGSEYEVEVSEYAEGAAQAFGIKAPKPQGIHALQPIKTPETAKFYRKWFGGMVLASIILLIAIINARGGPERVLNTGVSTLPATGEFSVADTSRPVRVDLDTNTDNSWMEVPLRVTGPDGQPVVDRLMGISYYYGYSDGERWTEGSQSARVSFMAPQPGTYTVEIGTPEGEAIQNNRVSSASIFVRESIMTIRWPIMAIILFAILFIWSLFKGAGAKMRRQMGGDWYED
jgi:hypothetical protein